ncbi:TauD/TfdA family dioxygenase [Thalassobaculum sp.]|uniref:TauD/TfdA dioxygenase family protein n=1 Tax=Thalassobaculum sp. TaxID=2022740 RepID=UPI0032EB6A37
MATLTDAVDLTVTKRHPQIGAEVRGIDLGRPLDRETLDQLNAIWMENPMLVFPGQKITDEQQIVFARNFGELEVHPSVAHRSSRNPEVYRVSNVDEQGNILPSESKEWQYLELTWLWHTDSSFREIPSKGSILHGITVPAEGGDTLFANMYEAYDALSDGTKAQIDGLSVRHSHDAVIARSAKLSARQDKGTFTELPPVEHPLVRRHPVTGRRSLFLSPHTMDGIVGMPDDKAFALLDELTRHATHERFVYRHHWHQDDVIMWDNRCTMHAVMPYDSANQRRIMHRTTIVGDERPTL